MSRQVVYVDMSNLLLNSKVVYEAMGYGSAQPDSETCRLSSELLEQAMSIARPRYYYEIVPCHIDALGVNVDRCCFETNKIITTLLRNSERLAIFVATAGEEFQEWLDSLSQSGDSLRMFILDAIGSSIVEATGDYMELQLQDDIEGDRHTNRFSPGYCGWSISEQHKLFSILPPDICGIKLSESSLMHPIKSISGIIGVGKDVITRKYGCSICNNKSCYLRKK